jgi:hypothetical protein
VIPQAVDSPEGDLPVVHQVHQVHQVPRDLLAYQGRVVRRGLPDRRVGGQDRRHRAVLAGSMARSGALTAAGTPVAARSDVEEW